MFPLLLDYLLQDFNILKAAINRCKALLPFIQYYVVWSLLSQILAYSLINRFLVNSDLQLPTFSQSLLVLGSCVDLHSFTQSGILFPHHSFRMRAIAFEFNCVSSFRPILSGPAAVSFLISLIQMSTSSCYSTIQMRLFTFSIQKRRIV